MVVVGHRGLLLLLIFKTCIISILQLIALRASAVPPVIVLHILLITLLRRPLIIIVAVLDHFIAHYRTVAIDGHAVVVPAASAADLVIALGEEALSMISGWRRVASTLHKRWQLLLAAGRTDLAVVSAHCA